MLKPFKVALLWCFTIWVYLASYVTMISVGIFAFPAKWLLGKQRAHRYVYLPAFSSAITFAFVRVTVTKHPDFDPEETAVFMQNHVSVFDGPLATLAIPRAFVGLFNSWHFLVPGYGWFVKAAGGIGVPSGSGRLRSIISQAKDRGADGLSILAFPEGHRTRDGNVRDFRKGAFVMAREAELPVIPLCVRGMWEVESKRGWLIRPGHVEVYVGKPQRIDEYKERASLDRFVDNFRESHVAWVEKAATAEDMQSL